MFTENCQVGLLIGPANTFSVFVKSSVWSAIFSLKRIPLNFVETCHIFLFACIRAFGSSVHAFTSCYCCSLDLDLLVYHSKVDPNSNTQRQPPYWPTDTIQTG